MLNFILFFHRFCYVRYANGLVKEGLKLLHFIIMFGNFAVFTGAFLSWLGKAWWQDTGYTDMLKGKFCNKESLIFTNNKMEINLQSQASTG